MKFSIVLIKFKLLFQLLSITTFVFIFIFAFFIKYPIDTLNGTVLLICFILGILSSIFGFITKKITNIGEIEFDNKGIFIYNKVNKINYNLQYSEIKDIVLEFFEVKGNIPQGAGFQIGLFTPSSGCDNKIIINLDNTSYKYNIFLENETDANRFKMLYRFLKENNVNVKLDGL